VIDIGFVAPYWRWHHFDWDHHRIRIDRDRFYRIEGHHRPIVGDTWQHARTIGAASPTGIPAR
jgi:hypothetical protein